MLDEQCPGPGGRLEMTTPRHRQSGLCKPQTLWQQHVENGLSK